MERSLKCALPWLICRRVPRATRQRVTSMYVHLRPSNLQVKQRHVHARFCKCVPWLPRGKRETTSRQGRRRRKRHGEKRINRFTDWRLITRLHRCPRFSAAAQFLCRALYYRDLCAFPSWINPFSFDTVSTSGAATIRAGRFNSLPRDWSKRSFFYRFRRAFGVVSFFMTFKCIRLNADLTLYKFVNMKETQVVRRSVQSNKKRLRFCCDS